jgi:hypothetical protein
MGLEGIVSKRKDSPYRSGRSPHWIKSKNPTAPAVKREAEEDWGRWQSMPQREFANQKALVAYAEQNDLAYEYEYTPAFAKWQRLLSPEQYEIVDAHLSWRESGDAVLEGHHTGRVGGQCTATRGDGYQAWAIAGPEGETGGQAVFNLEVARTCHGLISGSKDRLGSRGALVVLWKWAAIQTQGWRAALEFVQRL